MNTMRWRYGDTCPVMLPVDSDTVIEIGDLTYLDADDAKPASLLAAEGDEQAKQRLFHDNFAGVAMQASRRGNTQPIRVATSGVFEFGCASAALEVGDTVGPSINGEGVALMNGTVKKVAGVHESIGRCAKRLNPPGALTLVDIVSQVLRCK